MRMEATVSESWKDVFTRAAMHRRERMERFQQEQERRKQQKEARQDKEDEIAEDIDFVASTVALATGQQISAFSKRLDAYDTALVEALEANEQALQRSRENVDEMLSRAYELEDGRRVFRTEDGQQVIDEFGAEVGADVIHPDEIDPTRPTWDEFDAAQGEWTGLQQERTELLEFQEQVDAARERLDEDGLTADELDELRTSLEERMPEAVRQRVDPEYAPAPQPAQQPAPAGNAGSGIDLEALRRGVTAATAGL